MEILSKNIASSVLSHHGEYAPIQVIKATGDAPLFNIMRKDSGMKSHLYKHGLKRTPLYGKWLNIKGRLFSKVNRAYPIYGGRGITMYEPWISNAKLFCDYVSSLPYYRKEGYSLDRIDNNGNYEPGNLRWTTRHIQNTNQNMRKDNKSGFTGVRCSYSKTNPWIVLIKVNKKAICLGRFKTAKDAAIARNNYITENNLLEYKLNKID